MDEEIFDFGFSTVTAEELSEIQDKQLETEIVKQKLDKMYSAIKPLLKNLKSNPEKDYILWPDRLKKVQEFENYLQEIYDGEKL